MDRKRIAFAGCGTPLIKLIKTLNDAPGREDIEIAIVFVPDTEFDFFKHNLDRHCSFLVETISHIEKGKFSGHRVLTDCDYLVSFNNMHLIDKKAVEIVRYGSINYHAGLLPEYAGSYTYQWAIRNNETTFASTIHWIEGKSDAGPIICTREFSVSPHETGLSLLIKCNAAAVEMMIQLFSDIVSGIPLRRIAQNLSKRKFYSMNMIKNSGRILWDSKPEEIERQVRAADFSPFLSPTYEPYTETKTGILKVMKAFLGRDRDSDHPGRVIGVDHSGIEVATGGTRSIVLSTIVMDGKRYACPGIVESGIKIGDCFGRD